MRSVQHAPGRPACFHEGITVLTFLSGTVLQPRTKSTSACFNHPFTVHQAPVPPFNLPLASLGSAKMMPPCLDQKIVHCRATGPIFISLCSLWAFSLLDQQDKQRNHPCLLAHEHSFASFKCAFSFLLQIGQTSLDARVEQMKSRADNMEFSILETC